MIHHRQTLRSMRLANFIVQRRLAVKQPKSRFTSRDFVIRLHSLLVLPSDSYACSCSNMDTNHGKDVPQTPTVSVIVPVHNAAAYLRECLLSVLTQRDIPLETIELVLYDDASTDNSYSVALELQSRLSTTLNRFTILREADSRPKGCGGARNRACAHATAPIFIFQDADDVMLPDRICRSLSILGLLNEHHRPRYDIIGGPFQRIPQGSTPRYEAYHARETSAEQLFAAAFRDAPLAMPTVACTATVWKTCPFVEGPGVPEDLHFQYAAMAAGFRLHKLSGPPLVKYRLHAENASLSLHRRALLFVRVQAFERLVLTRKEWKEGFSIWNVGRDGKDVFNALSEESKRLVKAWGDINPRKIGLRIKNIPVVHFSKLSPPIACCVPLDRDGREFETNLASLNLRAGHDYVHLI